MEFVLGGILTVRKETLWIDGKAHGLETYWYYYGQKDMERHYVHGVALGYMKWDEKAS